MKTPMLAAVLFLSGCSAVTPVPTPTGGRGVRVACNELANCYERAAKECGPIWHIIDSSNAMKPTPQIIVECGNPSPTK